MDIMVSVVCNAYNHEKYIADTLDGFLMQKTNFEFEVLVHDDASTDKTAEIIQEYANKFPNLIKPILQKENQYSQNKLPGLVFQYPRVKGKYIALCEGDDYWTDPYKLQKQVDALEAHSQIDICAHAASVVCNGKVVAAIAPHKTNTIFPIETIITGCGGFVATNSLMFRKNLVDSPYDFMKDYDLDYFIQISGSLRGGMLYLCDNMSCYRQMTSSSWSQAMATNPTAHIKLWNSIAERLAILDKETNCQYSKTIERQIAYFKLNVPTRLGHWWKLFYNPYLRLLLKQPIKEQFVFFLSAVRRSFLNLLMRFK